MTITINMYPLVVYGRISLFWDTPPFPHTFSHYQSRYLQGEHGRQVQASHTGNWALLVMASDDYDSKDGSLRKLQNSLKITTLKKPYTCRSVCLLFPRKLEICRVNSTKVARLLTRAISIASQSSDRLGMSENMIESFIFCSPPPISTKSSNKLNYAK